MKGRGSGRGRRRRFEEEEVNEEGIREEREERRRTNWKWRYDYTAAFPAKCFSVGEATKFATANEVSGGRSRRKEAKWGGGGNLEKVIEELPGHGIQDRRQECLRGGQSRLFLRFYCGVSELADKLLPLRQGRQVDLRDQLQVSSTAP
eukprot:765576-Hanusia_phi.AAC.2